LNDVHSYAKSGNKERPFPPKLAGEEKILEIMAYFDPSNNDPTG